MLYNLQPARMWKRLSAALLDGALLILLTLVGMLIFSSVFQYDAHSAKLGEIYNSYAEQYNVDFDRAVNDYESMTEEEIAQVDEAYAALSSDEAVLTEYSEMLRLTLLCVTLGILLSYALLEFVLPLALGNGQTLGKKLVGIGLKNADGTKLTTYNLVMRVFLGKFSIETLIPVLLLLMMGFSAIGYVGLGIIAALLICDIVLMFSSGTKSPIHDRVGQTVCVDLFASNPMKGAGRRL